MRPIRNLVYFHVHDLGRFLPCYGYEVQAPRLREFAEEAVVFERAFCSSAACTPSRGCALSGRFAHSTGCIGLAHMGWPLELGQQTIVDDANAAGIETILSGVNHERHPRTDRYGADLTHSFEDWQTERAVDNALAYLQRRDNSQRFFLNVGSQQPHGSTWKQFADQAPDPATISLPVWCPDEASLRQGFARYHAAIRYMDEHFGRFVDGLRELGLLEETAVVFTTDHGMAAPRAKGFVYDRGLEIALMARLPGGEGAGRRQALVGNVDYRATWRDLLGIEAAGPDDGRSFYPSFGDPTYSANEYIFGERNYHGEKFEGDEDFRDFFDPMRSVRNQDYHLVWNLRPEVRRLEALAAEDPAFCGLRPEWELYDLRQDPLELINVAERPEYASRRAELTQRLRAWMEETGDFAPDGEPPRRPEVPGWGPNWVT